MSSQDLKTGTKIRGREGPLTVVGNTRIPGIHRVYNMTVEGDHVYQVSPLGALAHNNGCEHTAPARGPQTPAAPNVPGLPRGPGTAANPPPSLGAPGAIIGSQATVPAHLPANTWPALVVDGRVYVAGMHNDAWAAAGYNPNVQAYGFATIDAAGRVVRWGLR